MSIRRVVSLLSVGLVASATIVAAAPKKGGKVAPAKDATGSGSGSASGSGSGSGSASGSGSGKGSGTAAKPGKIDPNATVIGADGGGGAGSSVQMTEDAPPKDINGTDENPDAPKTDTGATTVTATAPARPREYPMEEVLRPITLPEGLAEVSIAPHFEIDDNNRNGFSGGDALRARYGITKKIQVGLQYIFAAGYHDPASANMKLGLHPGKAVGLDVTYLLTSWVGVKVGFPLYVSPVALSVTIGVPIKFVFGNKWAVGGMDDLFNFKLYQFAPTFYFEYDNALAAAQISGMLNPVEPTGYLRLSGYGIYQASKQLAILGRVGIVSPIGNYGGPTAGSGSSASTTIFLRAGIEYTVKKYLDLGATLGFDDLSQNGSFGPSGYLAVRI
jgi:hypothetical protein